MTKIFIPIILVKHKKLNKLYEDHSMIQDKND